MHHWYTRKICDLLMFPESEILRNFIVLSLPKKIKKRMLTNPEVKSLLGILASLVDCFTLTKVDICYWQNTKNERFQLGKHHLGKMFAWSVFNSQIKECMVKLVGSVSFFYCARRMKAFWKWFTKRVSYSSLMYKLICISSIEDLSQQYCECRRHRYLKAVCGSYNMGAVEPFVLLRCCSGLFWYQISTWGWSRMINWKYLSVSSVTLLMWSHY